MPQPDRTLLDPPAPAAAGEPTVGPPGDRPGVLVVDDEHMVRIMVQFGLERNGFDVWAAATGGEAIALYRERREHIAVALLDVRMPGLDGPETLKALREVNPELLACFMSGDLGTYEVEELLTLGARCVIGKPFRLDELAHTLRRLTGGAPAELLPSGGECRG
jgi:CheY-like chemotaxis protein